MIIKNGKVFQEDGSYKVTDLYVEAELWLQQMK